MNYISISDYLKTNPEVPRNSSIWTKNEKSGKYWILGSFKDGSVWTGAIQVKVEPENMYIKV